jgi:hypothetical protein
MIPRSDTKSATRNGKRPGDARREEIMALIAKIDAVLSEVEQTIPNPAEAS